MEHFLILIFIFYAERKKSNGIELLKHIGKVKGREAVSGEVSQDLKLKSLKV